MAEVKISNFTTTTDIEGAYVPAIKNNDQVNYKIPISDVIPTKTSDLENDSDFVTSTTLDESLDGKQDTLVSGTNIKTINGKSILGAGDLEITLSDDSLEAVKLPGVNTSDGYFSSTDSALLFEGDRTLSILFTTSSVFDEVQPLFVNNNNWKGIYIGVTEVGALIIYEGSSNVYSQVLNTSSTYLLTITEGSGVYTVYVSAVNVKSGSLTSYVPDTFTLGYRSSVGKNFKGSIYQVRLFNYALSAEEVTALWNNGNPAGYVLPTSGNLRTGCAAEYLPGNITTSQWKDSAGNYLDLTASGTPQLVNYNIYPDCLYDSAGNAIVLPTATSTQFGTTEKDTVISSKNSALQHQRGSEGTFPVWDYYNLTPATITSLQTLLSTAALQIIPEVADIQSGNLTAFGDKWYYISQENTSGITVELDGAYIDSGKQVIIETIGATPINFYNPGSAISIFIQDGVSDLYTQITSIDIIIYTIVKAGNGFVVNGSIYKAQQ